MPGHHERVAGRGQEHPQRWPGDGAGARRGPARAAGGGRPAPPQRLAATLGLAACFRSRRVAERRPGRSADSRSSSPAASTWSSRDECRSRAREPWGRRSWRRCCARRAAASTSCCSTVAPVLPVSDTILMQDLVDGLLLVVRSRQTPARRHPRRARSAAADKVMGLVLNDHREYAHSYTGLRVRALRHGCGAASAASRERSAARLRPRIARLAGSTTSSAARLQRRVPDFEEAARNAPRRDSPSGTTTPPPPPSIAIVWTARHDDYPASSGCAGAPASRTLVEIGGHVGVAYYAFERPDRLPRRALLDDLRHAGSRRGRDASRP